MPYRDDPPYYFVVIPRTEVTEGKNIKEHIADAVHSATARQAAASRIRSDLPYDIYRLVKVGTARQESRIAFDLEDQDEDQ